MQQTNENDDDPQQQKIVGIVTMAYGRFGV